MGGERNGKEMAEWEGRRESGRRANNFGGGFTSHLNCEKLPEKAAGWI